MYINSQTEAVQERVAIYKCPPATLPVCGTTIRCPLCLLDTAEHRPLYGTSV
ncbi:unnamed protein product [Staurois parvus]|uniref:Uncharacterized protein n=1 Tax=Staurois parvus TaxID=386267 RepID=A0ABN9DYX7_9NEOB|nr:unnamed protein product [Staurois parvus]